MAKILVVDDSKSTRFMVATVLASAGHQITEARDGLEALRMAQTEKYNLVVSDINMPMMDGLELLKELRKTEGYRFTPIIILTTAESDGMKLKGREAGATAWITKPFSTAKLLEVIKKITDLI